MRIFHESQRGHIASIMQNGLVQGSSGVKSQNSLNTKTDKLLDQHRPVAVKTANICREKNIYGYVGIDEKIIDIIDGTHRDLAEYIKNSSLVVLELMPEPTQCYVSDLDRYDAIKQMVDLNAPLDSIIPLIGHYWSALVPLQMYNPSDIRRPEVVITSDIQPSAIHVIDIG